MTLPPSWTNLARYCHSGVYWRLTVLFIDVCAYGWGTSFLNIAHAEPQPPEQVPARAGGK